jgi:hypothetical protein
VLTRRQVMLAAGALLTVTGAATPPPDEPSEVPGGTLLRVGMLTFRMPEGAEPAAVPAGWDWAAEDDAGVQLLVLGSTAAPTPELALASVLAQSQGSRFGLRVTGHPPVSVLGADAHRVWSVATTDEPVRTGVLVAATLGTRTAVCLLTGPDGWSPSARRSILASLAVSDDA